MSDNLPAVDLVASNSWLAPPAACSETLTKFDCFPPNFSWGLELSSPKPYPDTLGFVGDNIPAVDLAPHSEP